MHNEQSERFDVNGDDKEAAMRAINRYRSMPKQIEQKPEGLIQASKNNAS